MHSTNLCTLTFILKTLGERPWFQKTPTLTLSVVPSGFITRVLATHRLDLCGTPNVGSVCNNFLFSNKSVSTKYKDMNNIKNSSLKDASKGSFTITSTCFINSKVVEEPIQSQGKKRSHRLRPMDVYNF